MPITKKEQCFIDGHHLFERITINYYSKTDYMFWNTKTKKWMLKKNSNILNETKVAKIHLSIAIKYDTITLNTIISIFSLHRFSTAYALLSMAISNQFSCNRSKRKRSRINGIIWRKYCMFVNPLNCKDQKKEGKWTSEKHINTTQNETMFLSSPANRYIHIYTHSAEYEMMNVQLTVAKRLRIENVAIKIILRNEQFLFRFSVMFDIYIN